MKAHRYFAILVFILSAAWVLTGDFSSVGSAATEEGDANTVAARTAEADAAQKELQSVGVAVIPHFQHARSVRVSGVTQADKRTEVTARAGGIVGELAVSQGDVVKKGDLLLKVDPEGRDAALTSAQQQLEQRKVELEATRKLVQQGNMAKLKLDESMTAMKAAESAVEQAQAEIDKLSVLAPFDGVIDDLNIEQGATVAVGTPVATLIALDPIIGVGQVNEADLSLVKVGETAELRLVSNKIIEGKVRYISRDADATTRTYTVEVEASNPDMAVPAGMTTEVILRGEPVDATPVPRSVVTLNEAGELGIRSVDDEDTVVFHPIDLVDDSVGALILGGIPQGARVIIAGQNFVTEGQKVTPVKADQETIDRLVEEAKSGMISQ